MYKAEYVLETDFRNAVELKKQLPLDKLVEDVGVGSSCGFVIISVLLASRDLRFGTNQRRGVVVRCDFLVFKDNA